MATTARTTVVTVHFGDNDDEEPRRKRGRGWGRFKKRKGAGGSLRAGFSDGTLFATDEEFQIRISLIAQCVFILVNYLQQVAIISSPDLIAFPPEWVEAFGWLSVTALLDFRVLFGAENDLAQVFQIAVSTIVPVGIMGIIFVLLLPPMQREGVVTCAALASLTVSIVFFLQDLDNPVNPFVGTMAAILPAYAFVRAVMGLYVRRLRHKSGVSYAEIDDDFTSVEIYGWLFLLVTVYSSVFKTGLSFISSGQLSESNANSNSSVTGNGAQVAREVDEMIALIGLILPLSVSLVLIVFVFDRARRAQRKFAKDPGTLSAISVDGAAKQRQRQIDSGSFVVKFFKVQFWYFQIVLMLDKSCHLVINLLPDPVLAASVTLAYIVVFILFMLILKPYNEDQVVPGTPLTAGGIDVLGRISNMFILVLVILFNVLPDDGTKLVLTIVSFCSSAVTGLFWLYILIYKLQVAKTIASKYESLGYQASWIGVEKQEIAARVARREKPFTRGEALVLTEAQCIWICETGCISSATVFTSLLGLRADDMIATEKLEFATQMQFDEAAVHGLIRFVTRSRKLRRISLPTRGISHEWSRALGQALVENPNIVDVNGLPIEQLKGDLQTAEIDLSGRGIGAVEAVIIGAAISGNLHLRNLNLSNNELGVEGAIAIGEALGQNDTLRRLSLNGVALDSAGMEGLCVGLRKNDSLTDIDLGRNKFYDEGTNALADALADHGKLEILRLVDCQVGYMGKQALAGMLNTKSMIRRLRVGHIDMDANSTSCVLTSKHLSPADATLVSAFLRRKSTKWSSVKMENNKIGDEGANMIASALEENEILLSLDLSKNGISELGMQTFRSALQVNTCLQTLILDNNRITDEGVGVLAEGLRSNTSIQQLSLRDNVIGDAGAMALGGVLSSNQVLRSLILIQNRIRAQGATSLAQGLKVNNTLHVLDLNGNKLGDAGAGSLGKALETNSSLRSLMLENNGIGSIGASKLSEGLKKNGQLSTLRLGKNTIGDEGRDALAVALSHNEKLRELKLDGLNIDARLNGLTMSSKLLRDPDLRLVCSCLRRKITTWSLLHFSNSVFSEYASRTLGEALVANTTLETFTMKQNGLEDEGTTILADALCRNTCLLTINLEWQRMGDDGALSLSRTLRTNQRIVTLNLWKNQIGDPGGRALGEALAENRTLRTLRLKKNRIGDTGTAGIGLGLQGNTSLTLLDLSENYNGDKAAQALGEALQHCRLKRLENRIGNAGAIGLAGGIKQSSSLVELKLGGNKVGDAGARSLDVALREGSTLPGIRLGSNNVSNSLQALLARQIKWTL